MRMLQKAEIHNEFHGLPQFRRSIQALNSGALLVTTGYTHSQCRNQTIDSA
jgi:hypothetical protein